MGIQKFNEGSPNLSMLGYVSIYVDSENVSKWLVKTPKTFFSALESLGNSYGIILQRKLFSCFIRKWVYVYDIALNYRYRVELVPRSNQKNNVDMNIVTTVIRETYNAQNISTVIIV